MKHLRRFNEDLNPEPVDKFTGLFVVRSVEKDGDYILSITLSDGSKLEAQEDTGGELASLDTKGIEIKPNDRIKFKFNGQQEMYYDNEDYRISEYWGVKEIYIDGEWHPCEVGSEGGNTSTYLIHLPSKEYWVIKSREGHYLKTYRNRGAGSTWDRDVDKAIKFGTYGSARTVFQHHIPNKFTMRGRAFILSSEDL